MKTFCLCLAFWGWGGGSLVFQTLYPKAGGKTYIVHMNIIIVVLLTVTSSVQRHDHWWFYQRDMLTSYTFHKNQFDHQTLSASTFFPFQYSTVHFGKLLSHKLYSTMHMTCYTCSRSLRCSPSWPETRAINARIQARIHTCVHFQSALPHLPLDKSDQSHQVVIEYPKLKNQSVNLSINQSINQSVNQPRNQSINQSSMK